MKRHSTIFSLHHVAVSTMISISAFAVLLLAMPARAINPCTGRDTTSGVACTNGTVCVSGICETLKITLVGSSVDASSHAIDIADNAQPGVSIDHYNCLGTATLCRTPRTAPTFWTNHGSISNILTSGLRSARTYTESYIGSIDPDIYTAPKEITYTTWPGYPTPATVSNIADTSARVTWNTPFPGNSEVVYGLNPPDWQAEDTISLLDFFTNSSMTSTGIGWTVTYNGKIYKRNPAGPPSLSGFTPPNTHLRGVDAFDKNNAWIVGDNQTMIRTSDGGSNWQPIPPQPAVLADLYAVKATSPTTAWAVGQSQKIVYFDGGSNWLLKNQQPTGLGYFKAVESLDNKVVWAVGTNGLQSPSIPNAIVTRTTDGGASWTQTLLPGGANIVATTISTLDGSTIYVAGGAGLLWRSTDGGGAWSKIGSGTPRPIVDLQQVSPTEMWIASDDGAIHTTDSNASYQISTQVNSAIGGPIVALSIVTGSELVAVGDLKMVSYSLCHPFPGTCTIQGDITTPAIRSGPYVENLSGLDAGRDYYFAATSAGSSVASGVFGTFKTTAADTVPPTISFTNPSSPGLFTNNPNYSVAGIAADKLNNGTDGTIQSISLTDNGASRTVSGTNAWSSTGPPLTAGLNTLVATAKDASNNTTSATTTLTLDTQLPTVAIIFPQGTDTVGASTMTATGTAGDNDQVASMAYQLNTGIRTPFTITPGASVNWSAGISGLTIGSNTLKIFATDRAGNDGVAQVTFQYQEPTFTIDPTPLSQVKNAGDVVTYTMKVTSVNHFVGNVTLTVSGVPSGSSSTFTPATIALPDNGTVNSNLSIQTSASGPTSPPNFTITITGTSGLKTDTAAVILTLNPPPDFSLSSTPGGATVIAGNNTSSTITAVANATFTGGSITFKPVTGAVSGINPTLSSTTLPLPAGSTKTASLNVTTALATVPGTYPLTITATSGAITRTATFTVTVQAAPDLTITAAPTTLSVTAGSGVTSSNITANAINGFKEATTLSITKSPNNSNITALLTVTQISSAMWATPSQSLVLNVTTTSAVPAGNYTLTVNAVSTSFPIGQRFATVTLTASADTTPPVISNINVLKNATDATITWDTNELANDAYNLFSDAAQTLSVKSGGNTGAYSLSHSIFINNLTPVTTYYFSVTSIDQAPVPPPAGDCLTAGNCTTVKLQSNGVTPLQFTTLAVPDTTPPTVTIVTPATVDVLGTELVSGQANDNTTVDIVKVQITRQAATPLPKLIVDVTPTCTYPGAVHASVDCDWQFNWDTITTSRLINGLYDIVATAYDSAGNHSAVTRTVNIINDTDNPRVLRGPMINTTFTSGVSSLDCSGGPCTITVIWETDDASTSKIDYGTTSSYGDPGSPVSYDDKDTAKSGLLYTLHAVTLKNLTPNTVYHYKLTSCNISDLCTN